MNDMEEKMLEQWIQQYNDYIYRFAYVLYPQDASELVQRTWIQAWSHQDQLHEKQAIKSWLRSICYREFLMIVRSNKEKESIEELEEQGKQFIAEEDDIIENIVVDEMVENMRNGCFMGMASKLTLMQRSAFSMVDMFGLSLKDTASLMDISVAAVKGLLVRARNNLQSFFADHCQFMKVDNPCRCTAWINFAQQRDTHQHKIKTAFSALEYQDKTYDEQMEIRNKIMYYYHHMPIAIPDKAWYDELAVILNNASLKSLT